MARTQDIPAVTDAEATLADAKTLVQEIQRSEARIDGLKEQVKAEREHLAALNMKLLGTIDEDYPLFDGDEGDDQ